MIQLQSWSIELPFTKVYRGLGLEDLSMGEQQTHRKNDAQKWLEISG